MPDLPSPLNYPTLRDDLPRYPPLVQLLRVTEGTVPGPTAVAQVAGSSVLAGGYYVSFTQQRRTDSGLPRDREPCLAQDMNGLGLTPGFYLGRLAGSHTALPVYEVIAPSDVSGIVGPQGPQGEKGDTGATGSTGGPGGQGGQGERGLPGPIGSTGPAGSCGPCGSESPSLICGLLRELPNYNGSVQQILGHDANGDCRWYDVEECP